MFIPIIILYDFTTFFEIDKLIVFAHLLLHGGNANNIGILEKIAKNIEKQRFSTHYFCHFVPFLLLLLCVQLLLNIFTAYNGYYLSLAINSRAVFIFCGPFSQHSRCICYLEQVRPILFILAHCGGILLFPLPHLNR